MCYMHHTHIEHEKLRNHHSLVVVQKLSIVLFHLLCGSCSVSCKGSSASSCLWRPLAHATATGIMRRAMKISGPNVYNKRRTSNETSDQKHIRSGTERISPPKASSDPVNMLARTEGHFTEYVPNDPRTWK